MSFRWSFCLPFLGLYTLQAFQLLVGLSFSFLKQHKKSSDFDLASPHVRNNASEGGKTLEHVRPETKRVRLAIDDDTTHTVSRVSGQSSISVVSVNRTHNAIDFVTTFLRTRKKLVRSNQHLVVERNAVTL